MATVGAVVAVGDSAQRSSAATRQICALSTVDYQPLAGVEPGLRRLPRVTTGMAGDRLTGFLFYYVSVPWGRERRPGARIYAGGTTPGRGVNMKILWRNRSHLRSRWLLLEGRRLDGEGTFRQGFRGYGDFPSIVEIPTAGCWRLDIRNGTGRYSLTFLAI